MSKFLPPKFIDDPAEYAEYKKKLLRWTRITKTDAAQQAEVVLYHLESHVSGIQEKIDTALGDDIVNNADGMTLLIEYLDTIYKQDEMTNMWMKYKNFVRLQKSDDQSINEFIAEYEAVYKEAKDNGCAVSDTVLALNLLDSCRLSETDEKFVLTGIDFKEGKEQGTCYKQVTQSLRKYQSRDKLTADKDGHRLHVKEESVFVMDSRKRDALVAEGWTPPQQTPGAEGSSGARLNSPNYKGKKNRLDSDGNPLKCFHCQSEYHLAYECDQKNKKQNKSKKQPEQTMLSTLLTKNTRKYAMVCGVQATKCDDEQKPRTLSDVLSVAKYEKSMSAKPLKHVMHVPVERQAITVSELLHEVSSEVSTSVVLGPLCFPPGRPEEDNVNRVLPESSGTK